MNRQELIWFLIDCVIGLAVILAIVWGYVFMFVEALKRWGLLE